ncbi:S-methyl-5-thioribose-1-phosphate isomerase [Methanomassiliicoccus luminyensis]|uniref:S-methyl-5-thioribose-1-phosphate isomerase n=1 Tax=Methanomassiliicoccus luminyensis TaxID=1080712 RepID=UPI00036DCDC1|nr:S-methyl-5-thioribose-1-phosphate isomerase [Methanomassiliicoccus luminyensis]
MRVLQGKRSREVRAVWHQGGKVRMIDQRILPERFKIVDFTDYLQIAEAIKNMTVRGAPSIGATAAYGMALAARNGADLQEAAATLKATRPTAYDLFYAVDHMLNSLELGDDPVDAADGYADQIVEKCRLIGKYGADLIDEEWNIMTHCNAGALATVDIGTALAPIRTAWTQGKHIFVYVSETRPRLQGMKLTAWELYNEGIPHNVIVDGASGAMMCRDTNMVIVGADRIAANGDFANKIGTFDKAVLAHELAVPFYVAAPMSTFDFSIVSGDEIVIEDRAEEEVTMIGNKRIAPKEVTALNPSFDMTRAKYVTGFITEMGILRPSEIGALRKEQFSEEGDL